MRAAWIAGIACVMAVTPCVAEETAGDKAPKPLALALPANTDECMKTLEDVLEHALDADLLDDQVDEAETHLEKLETACQDGRYPDALEEAKAVQKLVSMNK